MERNEFTNHLVGIHYALVFVCIVFALVMLTSEHTRLSSAIDEARAIINVVNSKSFTQESLINTVRDRSKVAPISMISFFNGFDNSVDQDWFLGSDATGSKVISLILPTAPSSVAYESISLDRFEQIWNNMNDAEFINLPVSLNKFMFAFDTARANTPQEPQREFAFSTLEKGVARFDGNGLTVYIPRIYLLPKTTILANIQSTIDLFQDSYCGFAGFGNTVDPLRLSDYFVAPAACKAYPIRLQAELFPDVKAIVYGPFETSFPNLKHESEGLGALSLKALLLRFQDEANKTGDNFEIADLKISRTIAAGWGAIFILLIQIYLCSYLVESKLSVRPTISSWIGVHRNLASRLIFVSSITLLPIGAIAIPSIQINPVASGVWVWINYGILFGSLVVSLISLRVWWPARPLRVRSPEHRVGAR